MKLIPSTFFAVLVACCSGAYAGADNTAAAGSVTITVNPAEKRPISPYIYGMNFATKVEGAPAGLTFDRSGGNRLTAYNWETNASNAGSDWQYQNDNSLASDSHAGSAFTSVIAQDRKKGMASLVTFQLQGWVAGDMNGPVPTNNPPDKSRFKKVFYEKKTVTDAPFTVNPPVSDDYVFMDEFIWALDQKFPGQNIFGKQPATLPVFAGLDNEPDLWSHTHLEVQGPKAIPAEALIAKTVALATALKKQFPDVIVFGPGNYGFLGIYSWNDELHPTFSGSNWFADQYLTALRTASAAFGKPLVDVYEFHWYPEAQDSKGERVTTLTGADLNSDQVQAIVQSPRSLWDKTYKEKSWILSTTGGEPIAMLTRLQSHIDSDFPGTKIAIGEYNNGGGQHIAGTVAQADNLGIFGAHGVFAASFWPMNKETYSFGGFRAYRDFDGSGHNFGDTSLAATSSNIAAVAAYVSTDSTHPGRVVVVAINRSETEQVTEIKGQPLSGTAHTFQITAATAAKQSTIHPVAAGTQPASGTSLTVRLPPMSVTTVDVY